MVFLFWVLNELFTLFNSFFGSHLIHFSFGLFLQILNSFSFQELLPFRNCWCISSLWNIRLWLISPELGEVVFVSLVAHNTVGIEFWLLSVFRGCKCWVSYLTSILEEVSASFSFFLNQLLFELDLLFLIEIFLFSIELLFLINFLFPIQKF